MDGTLLIDLLRLHCYYYNWQIVSRDHLFELAFINSFVFSYSRRDRKGFMVLPGINFLRIVYLFLAYCWLMSPLHLCQFTSFSSVTPCSIINRTICYTSPLSFLKTISKICMNLFLQSIKLLVANLVAMTDQFMCYRLTSLMVGDRYLSTSYELWNWNFWVWLVAFWWSRWSRVLCLTSYYSYFVMAYINTELPLSRNGQERDYTSFSKVINSLRVQLHFFLRFAFPSPIDRYLSYTLSLLLPIILPINTQSLPSLSTHSSKVSSSSLLHLPFLLVLLKVRLRKR